jgi:hypothetical protein
MAVVLLILAIPMGALAWAVRGTSISVNNVRSYLAMLMEPPTSPKKLLHATTRPQQPVSLWHPQVLRELLNFNTVNLKLNGDQIYAGGVPKDAIASLTNPKTRAVAQADDMADDQRVLGVIVNGKACAYPLSILNYHEAINDQLGGVPIGVFFCPLCDSVSVVDRRIAGRTLEFGISGLLSNSNVLLYDRSDHALWSQVWMRPVSGPLVGKTLKHINDWQIAPFAALKELYPDATYVTKDTGHNIDYSKDPYRRYFASDKLMFPVEPEDNRYPNKTRMVGIELGQTTRHVLTFWTRWLKLPSRGATANW